MVDTNTKIKNDIQKLTPGSELIDLYVLDTSHLGGTLAYFVPGTISNTLVRFNGINYIPLPVEIDGMEVTGDGRLPRPKLRVANVKSTFVAMVNSYNDGIGSIVRRLRTFKKYLDGQSAADSSAQFPMDTFIIEQKTAHNNLFIEWELVSPMDIGTKQIPRNQVMKYCQHRYRYYKNSAFDYSNSTCPYTGTSYFDERGITVAISLDRCGKKYSDCRLRYPAASATLPFKGFPSVGQIGARYR